MLIGHIVFLSETYPLMVTSFKQGSLVYILFSQSNINDPYGYDVLSSSYYKHGGKVRPEYILGMIDVTYQKMYGTTTLLESVIKSLKTVRANAINKRRVTATKSFETYKTDEGSIVYKLGKMVEANIKVGGLDVLLTESSIENMPKRILDSMLTENFQPEDVSLTTFVDASWELLESRKFDLAPFDDRNYIMISTIEEFDKILVGNFIEAHKQWKQNPDFEKFLVAIDFESTGLEAFCDLHPKAVSTVFVGIAFSEKVAYGINIDMRYFHNCDKDELAKRLTNMFQYNPLADREITISNSDGYKYTYKRSEISTVAHNMLIDIRFGMRIGADIWFDYCTMQLGFNADPFYTAGHNGLKDRVTQFLGISYPELSDICGRGHITMFRELSDKRVILLYGCADADLLREYAKILITGLKSCKGYYGVDQVESFEKYDVFFMNYTARFDYLGIRVNIDAIEKEAVELKRKMAVYDNFLRSYVARVKAFENYYTIVTDMLTSLEDATKVEIPDLDNIPPMTGDIKWAGNLLLEVLFTLCQYPILVKTRPSKQTLASGKPFVPKPALDEDAVKFYLRFPALDLQETIDQAIKHPKSLKDLKLKSMYISSDIVDEVTGEVLISKKEFNEKRYPLFLVLAKIAHPKKLLTSELNPIFSLNTNYVFNDSRMATAVTRRELSAIQTTSSRGKWNYIAYDPDEFNILDVDQATVEIRIAWGLSGDRAIIEPLNHPEIDPHTETCAEFFNKSAYLVDRKKERKPVKPVNFGRIYGAGEYTICKQIFNGVINTANLAKTAELIALFDDKRSSVIKALDAYVDDMWKPRKIPKFLRKLLLLKPGAEYGRMTNIFHWTQHVEIKNIEDRRYETSMARKARNFAVQGAAATILRIVWSRTIMNFIKKGWIPDFGKKGWEKEIKVIPHLKIHDEMLMSYHKSLNPVEVAVAVRDGFLVQYKDFPKFFIGINFGKSWGEAKDDVSELPMLLIEQLKKEYEEGLHHKPVLEDHIEYMQRLKKDYIVNRIKYILLEINGGNPSIWTIEQVSQRFTNYTVRAYLQDIVKGTYTISDFEDPVEVLLSKLSAFISQYMLDKDQTAVVTCRKRKRIINTKTWKETYDNESSFMENRKGKAIIAENVDVNQDSTESEDDEIYLGYDFLHEDEGIAEDTGGIVRFEDTVESWDTGFFKEYLTPMRNGELMSLDSATIKSTEKPYKNFTVVNKRVTIKLPSTVKFSEIYKIIQGKQSTSANAIDTYVLLNHLQIKPLGAYKVEILREIDEYLSNVN